MQQYVGLDVHSKQTTFVIQDETGRVVAQGEISTTPQGLRRLQASHHLPLETPVALETGTSAFFVARQLSALGLAPRVIDAPMRSDSMRTGPDKRATAATPTSFVRACAEGSTGRLSTSHHQQWQACGRRSPGAGTSCGGRPPRSMPPSAFCGARDTRQD